MELEDELHLEITKLSDEGNAHFDAGDFSSAISCFEAARDLLPKPHSDWEAATWLNVAIGDSHFAMGEWEDAIVSFQQATDDIASASNPFIQLRKGQCYFELNDFEMASQFLTRAFALEGIEIFSDELPKYKVFLQSVLSASKK